jgi:GNAT superfamily N-acetyltransferase
MLTVTAATKADIPALAELFEEMDRFYGAVEFEAPEERRAQLHAMIFRDPPAVHVLLAYDDDRLAGFASYSFLWPAVGLTQSLFLKELYVAAAYRRRGVGRRLMQGLFELAAETGASRIEWMTEHANVEAIAFYERLGFKPNAEKVFYRITDFRTG